MDNNKHVTMHYEFNANVSATKTTWRWYR